MKEEKKKSEGLYKDVELELRAQQDIIVQLQAENAKLKDVIINNDLEDEVEGIDLSSVEEKICINAINDIKLRVNSLQYDDKDIKNFDTLFKILQTIRGKSSPKEAGSKGKKIDIQKALKVIQGG